MGRIESEIIDTEEQCGFCDGKYWKCLYFIIQKIVEKRIAKHLHAYLILVNLQKVYDIVPLKKLYSKRLVKEKDK